MYRSGRMDVLIVYGVVDEGMYSNYVCMLWNGVGLHGVYRAEN